MRFECDTLHIELVDEPLYSFGSSDNVRHYPFAKNLAEGDAPNSVHGLIINGSPVALLGSDGGATGVHEHSAVCVNGRFFVAIGNHIACLCPGSFQYLWAMNADPFTCFGIHFDAKHHALISHGELTISRFTEDGKLLWSASGADIFSEGLALHPDFIKATDFSGNIYRFDYSTGNEVTTA